MNRQMQRRLVVGGAGLALGGFISSRFLPEELRLRDRRPERSRVSVLSASMYTEGLGDLLFRAIGEFHFDLRAKTVVLKPNLVEFISGVEVNTNPLLVGAAAEAFLRLGATEVIVGEGPGHQRDTYLVLAESGLDSQLRGQKLRFADGSIMPQVTTGNTMAPCVIIGERAAEILRLEYQLKAAAQSSNRRMN
jgi:hypothetical protein